MWQIRSLSFGPLGKRTPNSQLTGRLVTLEKVEILMLAGYLDGKLGFEGLNRETLGEVEHLTRGGKDLFLLAVDGNKLPEAWDDFMWGTTTWLDHMDPELVQISNGMITCRGADNEHGGNMIDYFIMSKPFVAAIIS